MQHLRGKVAVVTGAASGIGKATASALAAAGARVHLVDLDGDGAHAVREELVAGGVAKPDAVTAHAVDCSDSSAVEQLARVVYEREGMVDILHNNAGVCCAGAVEEISLEDWRWTIDTNLWSVVNGVRAFVPRMLERGSGHVINTASMAGLVGLPHTAPYCASKFAVVGLSESLAAELGSRGIRVTVVCPGAVRTGILRHGRIGLAGDWAPRLSALLERHATPPERVADQVLSAIRSGRTFQICGVGMLPLWLLKRISVNLYLGAAALATGLALRAGGSGGARR